jgi:hypothetical protein
MTKHVLTWLPFSFGLGRGLLNIRASLCLGNRILRRGSGEAVNCTLVQEPQIPTKLGEKKYDTFMTLHCFRAARSSSRNAFRRVNRNRSISSYDHNNARSMNIWREGSQRQYSPGEVEARVIKRFLAWLMSSTVSIQIRDSSESFLKISYRGAMEHLKPGSITTL